MNRLEKNHEGTSLVVQGLRLCASNAGDTGLIPGQELSSHMLRSAAQKRKLKKKKIMNLNSKLPDQLTLIKFLNPSGVCFPPFIKIGVTH